MVNFLVFERLKYSVHIFERIDASLLPTCRHARMPLYEHLASLTKHPLLPHFFFLFFLLSDSLEAELPAEVAFLFIVTLALNIDPPLVNVGIRLVELPLVE